MNLTDLEPYLIRARLTVKGRSTTYVTTLAEAQGIMFLCPKCFAENGGEVGTHMVQVWFENRGVPAEFEPSPRWGVSGTGLGDLTIHPSIHILTGCGWHGWVKNGDAA